MKPNKKNAPFVMAFAGVACSFIVCRMIEASLTNTLLLSVFVLAFCFLLSDRMLGIIGKETYEQNAKRELASFMRNSKKRVFSFPFSSVSFVGYSPDTRKKICVKGNNTEGNQMELVLSDSEIVPLFHIESENKDFCVMNRDSFFITLRCLIKGEGWKDVETVFMNGSKDAEHRWEALSDMFFKERYDKVSQLYFSRASGSTK